jgi:hypothetical protein
LIKFFERLRNEITISEEKMIPCPTNITKWSLYHFTLGKKKIKFLKIVEIGQKLKDCPKMCQAQSRVCEKLL